MTAGFGPLPVAESRPNPGASRILGPRWIHLPTLTIGLLGVQVAWSVQAAYGARSVLNPTHARH
jgi:solute carrier family 45 protein 1/2/4